MREIASPAQGQIGFKNDGHAPTLTPRLNWARISLMGACGVFHIAWIALLAFYGL